MNDISGVDCVIGVGDQSEWVTYANRNRTLCGLAPIRPKLLGGFYAFTPGNHDRVTAEYNDPSAAMGYLNLLDPPRNAVSTGRYYSFDLGLVHIAMIDINRSPVTDACLSWLEDDLAASEKKWKIVVGHLNAYGVPVAQVSGDTSALAPITNRDDLFNVLKSGGANLFISGHRHMMNSYNADGVVMAVAPTWQYASPWNRWVNTAPDLFDGETTAIKPRIGTWRTSNANKATAVPNTDTHCGYMTLTLTDNYMLLEFFTNAGVKVAGQRIYQRSGGKASARAARS
jgi:hypothetical protein